MQSKRFNASDRPSIKQSFAMNVFLLKKKIFIYFFFVIFCCFSFLSAWFEFNMIYFLFSHFLLGLLRPPFQRSARSYCVTLNSFVRFIQFYSIFIQFLLFCIVSPLFIFCFILNVHAVCSHILYNSVLLFIAFLLQFLILAIFRFIFFFRNFYFSYFIFFIYYLFLFPCLMLSFFVYFLLLCILCKSTAHTHTRTHAYTRTHTQTNTIAVGNNTLNIVIIRIRRGRRHCQHVCYCCVC